LARSLGVALLCDGLGIRPRDLEQACGTPHRIAHGAHVEREIERLGAPGTRLVVGGQTVGHADVALRLASGPLSRLGVHPVAPDEQGRDIGGARHAQPHGTHAGADGGQQVGLAGGAEDPHGALRRLLERLQQHVRRALLHAIGVFDHHDAVARHRRRELRGRHQSAHLVDRDDHPLGREYREIGMRARRDLPAVGAVSATTRPAEQGRRERVGEVGPPRPGRAGDEPRVRHRIRPGVVTACRRQRALGSRAEHLDGRGLAGEVVPNGHGPNLPAAPDSVPPG
jgi:hypothetical protein